jgi:hypothetical protein
LKGFLSANIPLEALIIKNKKIEIDDRALKEHRKNLDAAILQEKRLAKMEEIKDAYKIAIKTLVTSTGRTINANPETYTVLDVLYRYAERNNLKSVVVRDAFNNDIEVDLCELRAILDEAIGYSQKLLKERHRAEKKVSKMNNETDIDVFVVNFSMQKYQLPGTDQFE